VFLIQPISKPVNDHLMELWIMIDAARRSSAGRITVVIPYYAYGRTDKKDQPRVAITARLIADFISVAGADRVLTIDLHAGQIQGFFNIPLDELSALRMLANRFREKGLSDVVVTATDAGAGKRAREVADVLDAPIAFVDKERRDNSEKAEAGNLVGDVRGKIALLIDEEISTGGTVVEAANVLLAHGATEVYCGATHAVFAGNAHERLASSRIKEFVVTDTLPIPEEKRFPGLEIISVAPLLGEAIRRIHNGDSIGAMFDEDFDLTVDRRVTTVPFATA
jgi:ribose-phosphate pyrophosphokinase